MASRYVGQCNVVRRRGDEAKWQAMIARAVPVSVETMLRHVDISELLDEDETPRQFMRELKLSDRSTQTYRSWWGDQRCWFIDTRGFEFIFVEE